MEISKFFRKYFTLIVALLFLATANHLKNLDKRPVVFIQKQDSSLNLNYNFLNIMNLGHKRLFSSLFWTATILESDVDHYKQKDLNSWMFLRFNTISKLEPKFLPTYTFGGPYLSIVKDDLEGASVIYNKGLSLYPDDYDLLRNAAFHFHFETNDHKRSFELYKKLKENPRANKSFLPTLARLESENGDLDNAYITINELYLSYKDKNSFLAQKAWSFLYAIKAEKDLKCLNELKQKCENLDQDGHPYNYRDGHYFAIKNWIPFRPKSKK